MKFCPNCGNKVNPKDNVCSNCGYRLKKPSSDNVNSGSQNSSQFPTRTIHQNTQLPKKKHTAYKVFITLGLLAVLGEGGYIAYQHFNQSSSSQVIQSTSSSSNSSNSSASTSSAESNQASDSNSTSQSNGYWNSDKESKFESFFADWSAGMNQDYTKYTGGQLRTASGSEFPAMFDRFDVNDKPVTIGLSKNGEGNNDYNVVAIYNHNSHTAPAAGHITYFFAFHNGEPVVLVDQTTNGDRIKATVTENKKLSDGFDRIANE